MTTDSRQQRKVYPNLAGSMVLADVDQLWRADITCIRLRDHSVEVQWGCVWKDNSTPGDLNAILPYEIRESYLPTRQDPWGITIYRPVAVSTRSR